MTHTRCLICEHYATCLRLIATRPLRQPSSLSKRALRRQIARDFAEHISKPCAWAVEVEP